MKPKKSLGQHWLTDHSSLRAMVEAAEITANDKVLEIGPGLGYLTDYLLKAGAQVWALEFDGSLHSFLQAKYQASGSANRLQLIKGDIRTFNLNVLPESYKICANIPYYLTANLLRRLTDEPNRPQTAALLVQKEVAQKVAADQRRSMLAVLVQAWYRADLAALVPARLFEPPPKVDSQILVLRRREEPLVTADSWGKFVRTAKMAFARPRQKLRANIAAAMNISKTEADTLLQSIGLDPHLRAEALTDTQWQQLTNI